MASHDGKKSLDVSRPALRVNAWVDAVFVLSVKTFTVRIEHVKRQMARESIAFEFMFAHDANELDDETLAKTFGPSELKRPHQSLVLKHIQTWRDADAKDLRRILVFEDDVILAADFRVRFDEAMRAAERLPEGYLIFLGGADAKVPDRFFLATESLVLLPMETTEAYVTDLVAIRRRLSWLETHRVTLPADHLIRQIDEQSGTAHYWPRRAIVEQGSVTGVFPSVLDGGRQKRSNLLNQLRYRWSKFRRHRLRGLLAILRSGWVKRS